MGASNSFEARGRGLFLWNTNEASANASELKIEDSVNVGVFSASANIHAYKARISWTNFWTIATSLKKIEATTNLYGRFSYLDLESEILGNDDDARAFVKSTFHQRDSLYFVSFLLGGGTFSGMKATWTSEEPNGLLDTLRMYQESEFFRKGIAVGTKLNKHLFALDLEYFYTRRAPLNDEHYELRDSLDLDFSKFSYRYKSGNFSDQFQLMYLYSNATFFGIRTDQENAKRFMYQNGKSHILLAENKLTNLNWSLRLGVSFIHLRLPKEMSKYKESLAPNRALDPSLLQTLSFSFYKTNFRLFGESKNAIFYSNIKREFHCLLGNFHFSPQVSMYLLYAQGELDMTLVNETTKALLIKTKKNALYHGEFQLAGSILNLGFLLESPQRNYFLQATASQIIPFYVHKELGRIHPKSSQVVPQNPEMEKEPSKENHKISKTEHLSPFKTGFGIDVRMGFYF